MYMSVFAPLFARYGEIADIMEVINCLAVFNLKGNFVPDRSVWVFYVAFHRANCGIDDFDAFLDWVENSMKGVGKKPDKEGLHSVTMTQRSIEQDFVLIECEVKYTDADYIAPSLLPLRNYFLLWLNFGRWKENKPPIWTTRQ